MLKHIPSLLAALFLMASCTPHIFGVPEEQWAQMTAAQQNVAMEAYYHRQKIDSERRLAEARRPFRGYLAIRC